MILDLNMIVFQKILFSQELEDVEEQLMFLEELGLEKPGVHYLIQSTYKLLKLQTYFTATGIGFM